MAKKKQEHEFPEQMFIQICDYCNNAPVFSAVPRVGEIPEDQDGELVAVYELREVKRLSVIRHLI